MKNAVPVHMFNRLQQLKHIVLDKSRIQVFLPPLDVLVHVAFHKLKDQRQSARRFVAKVIKEIYLTKELPRV